MKRVMITVWMLVAPALMAATGMVQTLDGTRFEGEVALSSGAVVVTATNGTTERIALASLASLKVLPLRDLSTNLMSGTGNGLQGVYFRTTDFSGPSISRLDTTVDFDWGLEAPLPVLLKDFFSVRWTGDLEAPVTGDCRFYLQTDDGGRLWLNRKLLIDQWQIQGLTEGSATVPLERGRRYDLRLEYFDNIGNAVARLLWSAPGIDKSVIPRSQLYARAGANMNWPDKGLLGIYFSEPNFTGKYVTRLDPTVNFDWGDSRPMPGLEGNTFSVRWMGQVQPRFDEHHVFHVETDGAVRLWVDHRLTIDQWKDEVATLASVPMQLKAGLKYDLRMDVAKTGATARARLFWSSPSTPRAVVPQEALFPADAATLPLPAAKESQTSSSGLTRGILLTSGSLIAAPSESANESHVKVRAGSDEYNLSTVNVACLVFQDVPAEVASRFQGRKGVLFTNRDFVDGDFKSVESGKVKLSSVLFGFQTYDISSRVAAVLLRDVAPGAWQFEVKTSDGSDLRVASVKVEMDSLVIEDAALHAYKVPLGRLSGLTRRNAAAPSP